MRRGFTYSCRRLSPRQEVAIRVLNPAHDMKQGAARRQVVHKKVVKGAAARRRGKNNPTSKTVSTGRRCAVNCDVCNMVIWVRVTRGGSSALDLLLDAAGARHHSPADWRCWQAGCRLPSCRVSSSKRKGGADCGCVDLVTYSRSKEPRAFFKRSVLHCVEAQPKQPSRRTTPRNEAWFR